MPPVPQAGAPAAKPKKLATAPGAGNTKKVSKNYDEDGYEDDEEDSEPGYGHYGRSQRYYGGYGIHRGGYGYGRY